MQTTSGCRWMLGLALAAILIAAVFAWDNRNYISPDGTSYLDLADAHLGSGNTPAVSSYWAFLTPCLLALASWLLRPAPTWEFAVAHLVSWLEFVAMILCFSLFLRAWMRSELPETTDQPRLSLAHKTWMVFAYSLAVAAAGSTTIIRHVGADLNVAALVYLAAAVVIRLEHSAASIYWWALLGAVLGLGYMAKSPMFPLSVALLVLLALCARGHRRRLGGVAVALACFLAVASPLLIALAKTRGRLTFGDSWRLNYAWYVNGVTPHAGWTGGPAGAGAPLHGPRVISAEPLVREFTGPIMATYPLWYDPAYWHEGLKTTFSLRRQIVTLERTLRTYARMLVTDNGLTAGLIVLLLAGSFRRQLFARMARRPWMVLWPAAAFAMFALVHVEPRYVRPFCVLFTLAMYGPPLQAGSGRASRVKPLVMAVASVSLILPLAPSFANALTHTAGTVATADYHSGHAHLKVAEELGRLGLRRGERIAAVGGGFRAYYARLARARIVAEIPESDVPSFLRLPPSRQATIYRKLADLGVKAVVSVGTPTQPGAFQWRALADTGYSALLLGSLPED
jgi:hypothetical protein